MTGAAVVPILGAAPQSPQVAGLARLPQASDFQAVLIGKDGGVKARWAEPVSLNALYELIDAMPMRQREMRERGS